MTNLEKLLDGVEVKYLPLGKITTYEQPSDYLVKSTNYKDKFPTPVLTAGKTFILGYTDEKTGIYKASINPVIIFDDFTTANKWVDFDFKAKSSAMKMITSKDETKILLRYIYHWLKTLPSNLVEGDHKRQWISNFSNKKIPIPCPDNQKKSLEIQRKIVDILDKFTTLETELKAELEAELEARKSQYEYYRDQLLSYPMDESGQKNNKPSLQQSTSNPNTNNSVLQLHNKVKWKTLGEITNIKRGRRLIKKQLEKTGKYAVYQNCMIPLGFYNESNVEAGTTFIISAGSAGEIGYSNIPFWAADDVYYFITRDNLQNKFLYYFLLTQQPKISSKIRRSSVPRLSKKVFDNLKIPIPPVEEQQRIVSILDKFDILTTSISEGLPKEIELRRKQYEYYRNELLSFPNAKKKL